MCQLRYYIFGCKHFFHDALHYETYRRTQGFRQYVRSRDLQQWLTVKSFYLLEIIHLVRTQIFQKTYIFYFLIRTRTCVYQGVRNVSFLKNFAYVVN